MYFPNIPVKENSSHENTKHRVETHVAESNMTNNDNYEHTNLQSISNNIETNFDAPSHINSKTKNSVKGSIVELIENVKNQMVADKNQLRKNRNSSSKEQTLEQFITGLIQPKIIDYLDSNLDRIVKEIVNVEIQKIVSDVNKD